jgi:hypothetical protein
VAVPDFHRNLLRVGEIADSFNEASDLAKIPPELIAQVRPLFGRNIPWN